MPWVMIWGEITQKENPGTMQHLAHSPVVQEKNAIPQPAPD